MDNLKLGYGGTAGEMARLINDSGVLGDAIEVTNKTVADVPFDKVIEAINVIQTRMGITGTTAKEAGRTIAGSVGSMKAAWTNLVTGFADGNADIETLIENLVETIVGDGTENNLGVIGNVLPAVERALGGIVQLIAGAAPKIIEIFPGLVEQIVPPLITAATDMVNAVIAVVPDLLNTVVDAIVKNAPMLIDSALVLVGELINGVLSQLPQIVKLGLDLIASLANGIADSLPTLIPTVMNVILQIVDTLTDPQNLSNLLQAALSIVTQLAWGLVNALPDLIDSVMVLIENIITFLVDPVNLAMIMQAAIELVVALGLGLLEATPKLMASIWKLVANITAYFQNYDWGKIGKNLVDGFKKGIQNAWTNLKKWFKNLFGDLIHIAKKILDIASPSKVFKRLGSWTAEGFGIGFEDAFGDVEDDIERELDFGDVNYGIATAGSSVGSFGSADAVGGLSIVQNIYSQSMSAAELMKEALYQQEKAVYLGV